MGHNRSRLSKKNLEKLPNFCISYKPKLYKSTEKVVREYQREVEQNLINSSLLTWDFDIFEFSRKSKLDCLVSVGLYAFMKFDIVSKCRLQVSSVIKFLDGVRAGYNDNPYHNTLHAADVLQAVMVILDSSMPFHSYSLPQLLFIEEKF